MENNLLYNFNISQRIKTNVVKLWIQWMPSHCCTKRHLSGLLCFCFLKNKPRQPMGQNSVPLELQQNWCVLQQIGSVSTTQAARLLSKKLKA